MGAAQSESGGTNLGLCRLCQGVGPGVSVWMEESTSLHFFEN